MAKLTDSVKKLVLACETKNNGSPTLLGAGYVDCAGWNQATFTLFLGAVAAGAKVNLKIQECDDAATWVDITGAALAEVPDTGDAKVYVIEVARGASDGRKRYHKPLCTVADGAPGAALCIECELSAFSAAVADVASADLGQRVPE